MSCFFGHTWMQWSEPRSEQKAAERTWEDGKPGEWKPITLTLQDRKCLLCGYYQRRRVPFE